MNAKMCKEITDVMTRVQETMNSHMGQREFSFAMSSSDVKMMSHQIRKAIDYLKLFDEVNRELIEDDRKKSAIGKNTRRYPMTPLFLEGSQLIN